jgi:hypothetical protein
MGKAEARVKSLTERVVNAAHLEARPHILWDETLKGFHLRVEPHCVCPVAPLVY